MLTVSARLVDRIDPGYLQILQIRVDGVGEVPGGVGGGQVYLAPATGKFGRDCRGDGRLTDAALAHAQNQAVGLVGEFVDQIGERGPGRR